jgi:hypothetical protein
MCKFSICYRIVLWSSTMFQGWIQDFKLGGLHLKNLWRAEGGANIFGVFRVKNHDFTPKNHIFSNCGGRRENGWGMSCEKSRFYDKKSYFFPIAKGSAKIVGVFREKNHDLMPKNHIFSNFRGDAHRVHPPPPWIRPWNRKEGMF